MMANELLVRETGTENKKMGREKDGIQDGVWNYKDECRQNDDVI